MSKITLLNCDCMTYMAGLPDKAFELAIVDPPYGIGISSNSFRGKQKDKDYRNQIIELENLFDDTQN